MKYFDYAATCPLNHEAADTYVKAATEYFGNTQSLHDIGSSASRLLEHCRSSFSEMLDVEREGIFFTSGGTESNFLGMQAWLANTAKGVKQHIICGIAEHSSIHSTINRNGDYSVTKLAFDDMGRIRVDELEAAITEHTVLVAIQHVNPEIGTIQPIREISEVCKKYQVRLHVDGVQSFTKLPLHDIPKLVDSFSVSGHKFYGPKGVGLLYLNPAIHYSPFYPNTSHERGIRPGTVNLPAIAAMTVAASRALTTQARERTRLGTLREQFVKGLTQAGDLIRIYGSVDQTFQLPSIIGMGVRGLEGQWVMLEANRAGYAISTGSACSIQNAQPSKTMAALGMEGKEAKEFIRVSFGEATNMDDCLQLSKWFVTLAQMHAKSPEIMIE